MSFHELSSGLIVYRSSVLLEVNDTQPLSLHLGHRGRTAYDAETIVNEPYQVIEVACAVLGVAKPFAHFL